MSVDSLRTCLAAGLATILAALALAPAFSSQRWLIPGIGAVGLVALTGYALRRLRVPRALVPFGQALLLCWAFLALGSPAGLAWGVVPTTDTVVMLGQRVDLGYGLLMRFAAPLPYDPDLVLMTALGVGVTALAVDIVAVTLRLVPWAGLPLLILYTIPAVSVPDSLTFLAFVPGAIGYLLLLMSESHDRVARWGRVIGLAQGLRHDPGHASGGGTGGRLGPAGSGAAAPRSAAQSRGTRPDRPVLPPLPLSGLAQTGRRVGFTVIGLAVLVPAVLPALPEATFGPRGGSGVGTSGSTIQINNPMLDLRRDLNLPENFELLTYQTNNPDPNYLRLVALDVFDGKLWKPSQRSVPESHRVSGGMPDVPGLDARVPRHRVNTSIHVTDRLQSKWLPLPYPAVTVDVPGDWRFDTATLDVVSRRDDESTAGLDYDVTGLQIEEDPRSLARAPAPPRDVRARYTETPDIPREVKDLARKVVGDAPTEFAQAAALQRWFRTKFVYSTKVVSGHSGSALMSFLADREGYCEQFAATMAIMARTLGIPARVGVGYMPGVNVGGSRWVVKVHDAHAWPELYFAGHGWVRFEPTPAQQTGLAPAWTERYAPSSSEPGTTLPRSQAGQAPADTAPGAASPPELGMDPSRDAPRSAATGSGIPALLVAAGALALLVLVAPMLVRRGLRRRRLDPRPHRGRDPEDRVDPDVRIRLAWNELADILVDLGLPWDEAATPRAVGVRLERRVSLDAAPAVRQLVSAVERTRYAREASDDTDIAAAVRTIRAALAARSSLRQRLRAAWYPASLLNHLRAELARVRRLPERLRAAVARTVPGQ